jgi:hypothetical protein
LPVSGGGALRQHTLPEIVQCARNSTVCGMSAIIHIPRNTQDRAPVQAGTGAIDDNLQSSLHRKNIDIRSPVASGNECDLLSVWGPGWRCTEFACFPLGSTR